MDTISFDNLGPYEGQDFEDAMQRLRNYPQLIDNFTDIISGRGRLVNKYKSFHTKKTLTNLLSEVHNCDEFQKLITCNLFLEMVVSSSMADFTYQGMPENDIPRVFITNHRDIVLDAALLGLTLYRENKKSYEMVIGNNLLVNQFVTDMFKVNGAITVRRDVSGPSDLKNETLRLSRYIRHCIEDKKKSVWIAQKSGRSKDATDQTSPAVLKMLYLSFREEGLSFNEFLDRMSITPASISYQYDPCDVTKSQEQIRQLKAEGCYNVYKKKKYEDIIDAVRGLKHYKGNVHIQICDKLSNIEDANAAAMEIDKQIHTNYKLWDTNFFAYDYLNHSDKFKDKYKDMNTKNFVKQYKGFNSDVVDFVYKQYANPVISVLKEDPLHEF